jgi:RNase P/RNase MRP subunit p29
MTSPENDLTGQQVRVIVVNNESYTGRVIEEKDRYFYLISDHGRHHYIPWGNVIVITVLNKKG